MCVVFAHFDVNIVNYCWLISVLKPFFFYKMTILKFDVLHIGRCTCQRFCVLFGCKLRHFENIICCNILGGYVDQIGGKQTLLLKLLLKNRFHLSHASAQIVLETKEYRINSGVYLRVFSYVLNGTSSNSGEGNVICIGTATE